MFNYLNVNSIRNNFKNFSGIIDNHNDVLEIAETKLYEAFENISLI